MLATVGDGVILHDGDCARRYIAARRAKESRMGMYYSPETTEVKSGKCEWCGKEESTGETSNKGEAMSETKAEYGVALRNAEKHLPVTAATAQEIRAQVNLIQEVMKAVMKRDVHFGTIPGTNKPSLYKPGAEKILATFRIGVAPEVEDLSTRDERRYRVTAQGFNQVTGDRLGGGVGECSTEEEKYKWRGVVCDEEFDETPEDRRRIKYKKYQGKVVKVKQVRTNPADLANAALKMAKKRAQVDMTLTVTGASDVFTQDIEDLPPEYIGDAPPLRTAPKPPTKKAAPKQAAKQPDGGLETTEVAVESVGSKDMAKGARYWIKADDGQYYSTFSDTIGVDILNLQPGERVNIEFERTQGSKGEFRTIKALEIAGGDAQPDDGENVGF